MWLGVWHQWVGDYLWVIAHQNAIILYGLGFAALMMMIMWLANIAQPRPNWERP